MRLSISKIGMIAGALLLTGACSSHHEEEEHHARLTGDLSRTLEMVDKDGRHYGTVEMDPLGGGRVLDASGRVIGTITPPVR